MDNLSTVDKIAVPNVSFIERSHCIIIICIQPEHTVDIRYKTIDKGPTDSVIVFTRICLGYVHYYSKPIILQRWFAAVCVEGVCLACFYCMYMIYMSPFV